MNEILDTRKGFEQWKEELFERAAELKVAAVGRRFEEKELVYCWNRNYTRGRK